MGRGWSGFLRIQWTLSPPTECSRSRGLNYRHCFLCLAALDAWSSKIKVTAGLGFRGGLSCRSAIFSCILVGRERALPSQILLLVTSRYLQHFLVHIQSRGGSGFNVCIVWDTDWPFLASQLVAEHTCICACRPGTFLGKVTSREVTEKPQFPCLSLVVSKLLGISLGSLGVLESSL